MVTSAQRTRFWAVCSATHRFSAAGSQYQISILLLDAGGEYGRGRCRSSQDLLNSPKVIRCDASSPIVGFVYLRPEGQTEWNNTHFKLGNSVIHFCATDSCKSFDSAKGYDSVGKSLLYQIQIIGGDNLEPSTIQHWIKSATEPKENPKNQQDWIHSPHTYGKTSVQVSGPPSVGDTTFPMHGLSK